MLFKHHFVSHVRMRDGGRTQAQSQQYALHSKHKTKITQPVKNSQGRQKPTKWDRVQEGRAEGEHGGKQNCMIRQTEYLYTVNSHNKQAKHREIK